jgi:hypothetical protein
MHLRGDFNAVRHGDLLTTSLRFAVPPYGLEVPVPGQLIRVEDGEGNSCWGTVEDVSPPLVRVRLDWSTWRDAGAVILTYEFRKVPAYRGYFFRHPTENQQASISNNLAAYPASTASSATARSG